MITASGLLETSHRIPNLDYHDLMKLTPAYDLTYSNSLGGEHATCVNGNGTNPGMEDLVAVGKATGLPEKKLKSIAEEIREMVKMELT